MSIPFEDHSKHWPKANNDQQPMPAAGFISSYSIIPFKLLLIILNQHQEEHLLQLTFNYYTSFNA